MKIAVAGGTGDVNRHVVKIDQEHGHEVAVLARSYGVDLSTGACLDLGGVDVVIDVTSVQTTGAGKATEFFRAVPSALLAAEQALGVGHHLALSIVGTDDAPHGIYAGKVEEERLIEAGEVPWTILRATQFHEFAGQVFTKMQMGPISMVPKM